MRKALAIAVMLGMVYMPLLDAAASAAPARGGAGAARQDDSGYELYSNDQLDNLLAPIALYPDPLLAQVLLAATFPDQVDEAARYVRAYGQNGVDNQDWDVSVKSVAHYPTALSMMADKLDWTTAVGQAYVYQSTDVMSSVQRLRAMARAQGNLVTTVQQQVVVDNGYIQIWPAQPQYIYLPVYDPYAVYYRRWPGWGPVFVSFTVGFLIGVWLNHDCDWRNRRVYYTGWSGPGWIGRSRPYVRVTNIYVNDRYRNVYVNRDVSRRNVNYYNLNRYNTIHRDVNFDNRARKRNNYQPNQRVNNQIIQRNIDTGNPRLDRYRGHQQQTPSTPGQQARPAQPTRPIPVPPSGARPQEQPRVQQQRPQQSQPQPPGQRQAPQAPGQQARPAQPTRPIPVPPSGARPQEQPRVQQQRPQQSQPQQPGAFNRGDGGFSPKVTSQRGQSSRSQAKQPPRPAPSRPSAPQRSAPQSSAPSGRSQGRSR